MAKIPLLFVDHLHVSVEGKEVVQGVNLTINEGEVHAIMGPNGSGKSSLVHALMGHPRYTVTKGEARFTGEDLLSMPPDERAKRGLFLAFQYPKEIAGVALQSFLLAAYRAQVDALEEGGTHRKRLSPLQFQKLLLAEMEKLKIDPSFADRSLNKGFSGGEKKKAEILQMQILKPWLALLDETDSGLDVDALKIVAEGVNDWVKRNAKESSEGMGLAGPVPEDSAEGKDGSRKENRRFSSSAIIVTHYARILEYITPDHVHVMVQGKIVASGGHDLARTLEREGYRKYGEEQRSASLRLELE